MALLTLPSENYRDSYLEALGELQAEGRQQNISREQIATHFSSFVQRLHDQADIARIEPGQIPFSEFWLVDGNDYLGTFILRHKLDEFLLQKGGHIGYVIRPSRRKQGNGKLILNYGLEKAKARGLERVLLTCDEENRSSRAIIEVNGGVLENIIQIERWPVPICRYWIQLV
ncbi:acetyltransferase [Dictyobacter vulcani]|uniref:Acetyltransferase n=1 Tax=Dictyobacter vulcani TaxID=2607529 RepID=A0A5J4KXW3_9CHLR|nr:GNAT family N-acetyltransferase [Dictyobacter vulcani]GER91370.1 acetyltransferase [Dictyobacter vulcani]